MLDGLAPELDPDAEPEPVPFSWMASCWKAAGLKSKLPSSVQPAHLSVIATVTLLPWSNTPRQNIESIDINSYSQVAVTVLPQTGLSLGLPL